MSLDAKDPPLLKLEKAGRQAHVRVDMRILEKHGRVGGTLAMAPVSLEELIGPDLGMVVPSIYDKTPVTLRSAEQSARKSANRIPRPTSG